MECTKRTCRYGIATACTAIFLTGCASTPSAPGVETAPPALLVTIEDAGVRDLRGSFRAATCSRLPAEAPACDDVLLRLPGETASAAPSPSADLPQRYRIAFVPGFLSECFDRYAQPFADAQRALRAEGFTVDYFRVPGRGTTAESAQKLAEHFAALDGDPRPIILFAYRRDCPIRWSSSCAILSRRDASRRS